MLLGAVPGEQEEARQSGGPLHIAYMAERGRFELPVTCATPLFESGTINHSDTSPPMSVAEGRGMRHEWGAPFRP